MPTLNFILIIYYISDYKMKGDGFMTITKHWSKNQCSLTYKTDIRDYNEYWYKYTKDMLKPYQFIIIDGLTIPRTTSNEEIMEFLQDFCRLMTIENRIVIYDNELFVKYLERMQNLKYYDDHIEQLNEILCLSGFDCIQAFDYSYNYKDVFIYTKSKLGMMIYDIIMKFYGYNEDDY